MAKSLLQCVALLAAAVALANAQQTPTDPPIASPSPTPPPNVGATVTPSPVANPPTSVETAPPGTSQGITVPAACGTEAHLKVDNGRIVVSCASQPLIGSFQIGAIAELVVGVEPPTTLFIDALTAPNINTLDKLIIQGGAVGSTSFSGTPPKVELGDGLTGLSITSLSLIRVNFANASVVLKIPDTVAYLKLDTTNAEGLSLTVADNSTLNKVDFLSNNFSKLPACLYERKYTSKITAVVNFTTTSTEFLPKASVDNLLDNLNGSSGTFDVDTTCDANPTVAADLSTVGKHHICTDPLSLTPSPGASTAPDATSTPGNGGASADSTSSSGGSSNGTVIGIIVAVSVVVVVLAATLWRKLVARKKQASQHDDNAVNLIGKEDASGAGKLSFISGDEALRPFRLQQHDVTLTKSLGPGLLWLGEYNGAKVLVKRVEAESSDAYVTKNLMSQAQVLATLSHENLVPLVGVTWLAGTDFALVAEFMDKSNLKNVLADQNWQLDLHTRLRMCLDVARGLAYLHASDKQLYVRNLSSRKVLVNSSSECKLNLFDCYPSTTKFEAVETYGAGDVAWVAPELITRSSPQDLHKINVYALGVVLCEILARAAPFQSLAEEKGNTLSDVTIVAHIRRQEPLPPHENRREYMRAPQSLRDAVDRCLALSPLDRPSAADMVAAIEVAQTELLATQQLI